MVSDANTGNGVRMNEVANVDESEVNDATQGGIMSEVRTDVNVNDGKDDRVANDDSGDSEVLTDVCNDGEYGAFENGSTMDKVCSDVVFETDESKEGGEVVDVCNIVNGANGRRRNGGVMVYKCTAVHCGNNTDRAGGVTVYECNFDGNVEDIVKRDIREMDDVCNDLNVENSVSMDADTMGDARTNFDDEKVKWTVGKGNKVNAENDVNRSGGSAVDMCSDVFRDVIVESDVNRSEGVEVGDVLSDVNAENVCNDVNIEMEVCRSVGVSTDVCSDVCNDVNTKNDANSRYVQ